jgi:hypothetical protein
MRNSELWRRIRFWIRILNTYPGLKQFQKKVQYFIMVNELPVLLVHNFSPAGSLFIWSSLDYGSADPDLKETIINPQH